MALLANAVLTLVLIWTGTLDSIVTFTEIVIYLFFAMTGVAALVLRRRHGTPPGVYRVWGFPYTPAVFIALNLAIVLNGVLEQPREALFGIAVAAVGIPLYWISWSLDQKKVNPT